MKQAPRLIPDYGKLAGLTMGRMLEQAALDDPEKELFVFEGNRITYGRFYEQVRLMGMAMKRLGIKKGDRVAALLPNSPEFFVAEYATLYIGGVFVLLSTRYREYELEYMLKHSKARCLFTIREYMGTDFTDILEKIRPQLPELEVVVVTGGDAPSWGRSYNAVMEIGKPLDEASLRENLPVSEDIASILYTSGSTGLPKGVMMSHRAFVWDSIQVCRRLRVGPDDVTLVMLPCSHTLCAFVQFSNALMARCKCILMETFEAGEALRLYDSEHVSLIYGVPTMFLLMLSHPDFARYDFGSSRTGYMGGAFCTQELVGQVTKKMKCRISCTYGMSENGCCTINDLEDDDAEKETTVGRPIDGMDIKLTDDERRTVPIGEVGEIALRGPNLFSGYYEQPAATEASFDRDGYFYTGDLGRFTESGCLTIVGRKKEMIIRGGFNVYPVELEEQIRLMEGVQNVAVIGLPDNVMGEKIVACVIPFPGHNIQPADVISFCKKRLANYKVPNIVMMMDQFPLTPLGKVQKFKLKEMLETKPV